MSASGRWSATGRKPILVATAVVLLLTSGAVAAQKFLITSSSQVKAGAIATAICGATA
jgi:hypothetical protein